jgi:hypothetical protein
MKLRRPYNRTLSLGIILIGLANLGRILLEHHSRLPEDTRDGISGLLLGIAFGVIALGFWRARQSACRTETQN